jgi:hypothetical protein
VALGLGAGTVLGVVPIGAVMSAAKNKSAPAGKKKKIPKC